MMKGTACLKTVANCVMAYSNLLTNFQAALISDVPFLIKFPAARLSFVLCVPYQHDRAVVVTPRKLRERTPSDSRVDL